MDATNSDHRYAPNDNIRHDAMDDDRASSDLRVLFGMHGE
jgi:hypothetical protein